MLLDDFGEDVRGADHVPGDQLRARKDGRQDQRDGMVGNLHGTVDPVTKTCLGILRLFILLHDAALGF